MDIQAKDSADGTEEKVEEKKDGEELSLTIRISSNSLNIRSLTKTSFVSIL